MLGLKTNKAMTAGLLAAAVAFGAMTPALASPPAQLSERILSAARKELGDGKADAAVRLYEAAIVANPANAEAYIGLGRAHVKLERPNLAAQYFESAVKIDPNNLPALEAQSIHFINLGDLAAAEQNIDRLKRLCATGCDALSTVLKAYDAGLEANRTRVLGESADG